MGFEHSDVTTRKPFIRAMENEIASSAEVVNALKDMTVGQAIESSSKFIKVNSSSESHSRLSLRPESRKNCKFGNWKGIVKRIA